MTAVKSSDIYLRVAVAVGTVVVVVTESLGALHLLTRPALWISWIAILSCAAAFWWKNRFHLSIPRLHWCEVLLILAIAVILGIVGFTAFATPPNSTDAMAYHLPRVIYWAQQRSVAFFATPYLNQIMLQPFAEYLMLHTYILSGGDHFVNFVQWFGCLTSIIGVAAIVRMFGASLRGQLLAALFCATLPNGILQASGAKNDYLLAAWLAAGAYFLLCAQRDDGTTSDAVFAGLAFGLAIGTKATAYLFAPFLILAIAAPRWRWWQANFKSALIVAFCTVILSVPQFMRNMDLSGSPLGFDSAQADGHYRWSNDHFGWRETVSNILRHSSEQLGARSDAWNQRVYNTVLAAHQELGIDPNDPAATWPDTRYEPPLNTNHEVNAPNRWHLALLAICFFILPWRRSRWTLFLYLCGLIAGFVLFCTYLKWQLFMGRLFLPLFVLASPAIGVMLDDLRPPRLKIVMQAALAIFLINNTRHYLFENWIRPLKGPHSILRASRDDNYFNDMSYWNTPEWNIRVPYYEAVDMAMKSGCSIIGIDANDFQLEYPFQALLIERNPQARFTHIHVHNPSNKYTDGLDPCAEVHLGGARPWFAPSDSTRKK